MSVWCEHCRDHFDTDHYIDDAHGVGPDFGPYGALLAKATPDLRDDERTYLAASERCEACGHLDALHNHHCCEFCSVPDCRCEWGKVPSGGTER